jgi:hypothetical protein
LISRLIGYYRLPQSEIETSQQLDLQSVNSLGRSRKKLLLVVSAEPAQASKYTHTHNSQYQNQQYVVDWHYQRKNLSFADCVSISIIILPETKTLPETVEERCKS